MSPLDGVTRQNIKITDVKMIGLAYRLKPEEQWPDSGNNNIIWKTESVIVEVSTDTGDLKTPAARGAPGRRRLLEG